MARGIPFKEGNKGKPKGAISKVTKVNQQFWQLILDGEADNITASLKDVRKDSPTDYLKIILNMTEFVMPKLARTELTGKDGDQLEFTLNLNAKNPDIQQANASELSD